jgi:hypothetical protein
MGATTRIESSSSINLQIAKLHQSINGAVTEESYTVFDAEEIAVAKPK